MELSIQGDNFLTGKPYRGSVLVTTADTLLDVKLRLRQATGFPLFAMKLRAMGGHDLWGYFEDTANVHERVQAYMERHAQQRYTPLLSFSPFVYDLCLDRHVSAVCCVTDKSMPIDISQRRCLHAGSDTTIRWLPIVPAVEVLVLELQALGGPSTRFLLPTEASAVTFLTLARHVHLAVGGRRQDAHVHEPGTRQRDGTRRGFASEGRSRTVRGQSESRRHYAHRLGPGLCVFARARLSIRGACTKRRVQAVFAACGSW